MKMAMLITFYFASIADCWAITIHPFSLISQFCLLLCFINFDGVHRVWFVLMYLRQFVDQFINKNMYNYYILFYIIITTPVAGRG